MSENEAMQAVSPVVVIGAGYIGLPYAAALAAGCFEAGPQPVVLLERSRERVASIQQAKLVGEDPLGEPGLCDMMNTVAASMRIVQYDALQFLGSFGVLPSAIVIAIGTPPKPDGQGLDLQPLIDLVSGLCEIYKARPGLSPVPIVIRSTITPSCAALLEALCESPQTLCYLYVVPEFLQEGAALAGLTHPDRLVFGVSSKPKAPPIWKISDMFCPEGLRGPLLQQMTPAEAALVKLTSNALLSLKIEVATMVADYVEANITGGDAARVLLAVGCDTRIGFGALRAGLGPMGPCLPKDWGAFVSELGPVNPSPRLEWPSLLELSGVKRAVAIGIGFKPTSPDWRSGPVLAMMRDQCFKRVSVLIWDERLTPGEVLAANRDSEQIGGPLVLGPNNPIPDGRDAIVYLFAAPPADWLMELSGSVVIDCYGLLNEPQIRRLEASSCLYIRRGIGPKLLR